MEKDNVYKQNNSTREAERECSIWEPQRKYETLYKMIDDDLCACVQMLPMWILGSNVWVIAMRADTYRELTHTMEKHMY